jgi:hypothetical protein
MLIERKRTGEWNSLSPWSTVATLVSTVTWLLAQSRSRRAFLHPCLRTTCCFWLSFVCVEDTKGCVLRAGEQGRPAPESKAWLHPLPTPSPRLPWCAGCLPSRRTSLSSWRPMAPTGGEGIAPRRRSLTRLARRLSAATTPRGTGTCQPAAATQTGAHATRWSRAMQTDGQTGRQTGRWTDGQTGARATRCSRRNADGQTDRQGHGQQGATSGSIRSSFVCLSVSSGAWLRFPRRSCCVRPSVHRGPVLSNPSSGVGGVQIGLCAWQCLVRDALVGSPIDLPSHQ